MTRRLLLLLGALLPVLGLLVAAVPASTASPVPASADSSSRRPAPGQDYPRLPAYCASHREKIPSKPVICKLNRFDANRPTIVLWGDSHAWMLIPALEKAASGQPVNLVAIVEGTCPPMDPNLSSSQAQGPSCDRSNQLAIDYTRKLQSGDQHLEVVLGASWQRYFHAVKTHDRSDYVGVQAKQMQKQTPRLFHTLADEGISVTVNGQVATVPATRKACAAGNEPYACDLPVRASLPEAKATYRYLLAFMRPLPGNPKPLNIDPDICSRRVCHGKIGSVRTWFDDLHLSATRSRRMAHYLQPVVEKALGSPLGTGTGTGGGGGTGCPFPLPVC